MSKVFLIFILLLFAAPTYAISSDIYPYVGITLGSALTSINKMSDSSGSLDTVYESGHMAGALAGITFETNPGWNIERIRAEAEAGYRSSELLKFKGTQGQSANLSSTLTVTNYMLNGYFDNLSAFSKEVPAGFFITAGAGIAVASIKPISYQGRTLVNSASNTQFAYQGGAGIGVDLTKSLGVDVTYKYLGTTPFKFAGVKAEYGSHNIMLGVKHSFK